MNIMARAGGEKASDTYSCTCAYDEDLVSLISWSTFGFAWSLDTTWPSKQSLCIPYSNWDKLALNQSL